MPTVTSFTRIKSDDAEGVVKNLKEAKKIIEKHGAEFLRVSRFHTGPWIGDWLVVVRFPIDIVAHLAISVALSIGSRSRSMVNSIFWDCSSRHLSTSVW